MSLYEYQFTSNYIKLGNLININSRVIARTGASGIWASRLYRQFLVPVFIDKYPVCYKKKIIQLHRKRHRMASTSIVRWKAGFYSREHCRGSSLPSPQSSTTLHTLLRATQRPLPHWNSLSRQESTVVAIRTQTNTGQCVSAIRKIRYFSLDVTFNIDSCQKEWEKFLTETCFDLGLIINLKV